MKSKFLILALAFGLLTQTTAVAQPEAMQLPAGGRGGMIRMEGLPARNLRPTLFLQNINTPRKPQTYASMPGTLAYGMINLTTFWLDVPKNIVQVTQENDVVVGSTYGFGKGVVEGLARGATSVPEVATLGLMPKDKPVFEPEYQLADPNQGFKVKILEW